MKIQSILIGFVLCAISASVFAKAQSAQVGDFIIYNDTNRVVTISVGNFFPTPYTIRPHGSRYVTVSTNNQNIHIETVN
ncbi:MAG TPA: hypothetical protein VJB02_03420 [Coxiellaceae bacterium]|nr:hypothetical protein [Coxiellaceae bacterium]